jgi:hypothetical protein
MAIRKEGAFIEINLPNGKYSYGRILAKASFAFYNIYSDEKVTDLDRIGKSNVLFINAVYKYAITKSRWKIIGVSEIKSELQILPMEFIQDILNPTHFEIYNPNTGEIKPAKRADCIGLEKAAVWEPEHIEDRIIDYFEGRPNRWVESLKIKV